jgi:peptide/nickel transport system permease protein
MTMVEPAPPDVSAGWRDHFAHVMRENPVTGVAFVLFGLLCLVAALGPTLAPFDPLATGVGPNLQAPSARHWFGTDQTGRDIFSRVLVATRLDLFIAFAAVSLSFAVGSAIGCLAGFHGGWVDRVTTRAVDTIMAFPLFVLAMGIVAALGNTIENIVYATAIVNIPFYARVARAEVNVRREAGFVEAARLAGNSDVRILAMQIFPNVAPVLVVQASLNLGWAILNAAGLSFIGLGVRPPTAEWGIMVAEGAAFIVSGDWWIALFPGLALMVTVFTFNLMGDGLRDLIDPRRRT